VLREGWDVQNVTVVVGTRRKKISCPNRRFTEVFGSWPPLLFVGVFAMLVVTGTALHVSSVVGIILMAALLVKDGMILFECVHKLREEERMPLDEARGRREDSDPPDSDDHSHYPRCSHGPVESYPITQRSWIFSLRPTCFRRF
jgi:hypothetical protein